MSEEVISFHGVYLLFCINPKFRGRTYIGYTVNPRRRIEQHNAGSQSGGAHRTSGRGPWDMILIIHGFPSEIAGLQFEWAWQKPLKSRRIRHLAKKSSGETKLMYCFRVVTQMLRTPPWCYLPLTVRWLMQEYLIDFPADCQPPLHMPIAYGPLSLPPKSSPVKRKKEDPQTENVSPKKSRRICVLCDGRVDDDDFVKCLSFFCKMNSHCVCLARVFCKNTSSLLPVSGPCPSCKTELLWGDLIRKKLGIAENNTEVCCQ